MSEENNNLVTQSDNSNTELNANAEFKGNKDDEEDVLLTAQRYLNIFHQIHIFKEFRQEQFKKQLLEIPQEIRKIIALLPGGRVLLEHIAELMEEAGKRDPALDALLLSLSQNDHFSDNKIAAAPSAPALAAPAGVPAIAPQVVSAPIELSSDFTNALTDSFKAYSQNLKDLSANIQKMALNTPTHSAGSTPNNDYTKALTASFQSYSQDLKDLTSSIKQIAESHHSAPSTSASSELDGEVAKSLTTSFDTYARNLEDLTKSVKKIAENQHQTPVVSASPASIELGGDFSKALTASFEAYSHNLENLTESIKQIATNNIVQQNTSSNGVLLPNFTDSISTVLKENAQQQMNVLKSFGEMLSKTITDSQRELISSIKTSNHNSSIFDKFMQVPTEDATNSTPSAQAKNQTSYSAPNKPKPVSVLSASASENIEADISEKVSKSVITPQKNTSTEKNAPKQEPKKEQKPEVKQAPKQEPKQEQKPEVRQAPKQEPKKEQKPEVKQAPKQEPKKEQKPEKKADSVVNDLSQVNSNSEHDIRNNDLADNEIDINDIFAQVANSLHSENTQKKEDDSLQADSFAQAFDTVFSDSTKEIDDIATPASEQITKDFDPMAQIRSALHPDKQISLNDFDDDISPISLSPEDDLQNAFSADDSFTAQSNHNNTPTDNTASAFADSSWKYIGGSDTPNEASDDNEWEYEYEYEYVDENGNPINPSDDNVEYEYVDENGNPINPSDDNVEYEYVDENGNPINPSDDDEWEYEYVDENGNPIKA